MVFRKAPTLLKKKNTFFANKFFALGGLLIFFHTIAVCSLHAQTSSTTPQQVYRKTHLVELQGQEINEGSTIDLSITVGDVPIKRIDVLSDNFEIIGRSISSRINFDNGIPSKETLYIYRLLPFQAGKYKINVSIDGEIYGPFLVNIIAQQNRNQQKSTPYGADARRVFAKLHSQKKLPLYINEPTTLIYEIFSDTSYNQAGMPKPSNHIGLVIIDVPQDAVFTNPSPTKVEVNGKFYNKSVVLRKIAYPLFAGNHSIEGGMFRVQIPVSGRFNKRLLPMDIKIPVLEIQTIDFPTAGKPQNFKNNFGDFKITITAASQPVEVGMPQLYKIKASGSGNFEALILPKISQSTENDYFVNQGNMENAYRYEAGNFYGSKTRDYYISYNKPGEFTLPNISFSAFSKKQGYMETNIAFPTVRVYGKDQSPTVADEKTKKAAPKVVTELSHFDQQQDITLGKVLLNHLFAGIAFVVFTFSLLIIYDKRQKQTVKNNTPLVVLQQRIAILQRENKSIFKQQGNGTLAKKQQRLLLIRLKSAIEDFLYKTNHENKGQTLRNISKKLHQQLQAGVYLIEEEKKKFALYIDLLSKVDDYQQRLFNLKIDGKVKHQSMISNVYNTTDSDEFHSTARNNRQQTEGALDKQIEHAQTQAFKKPLAGKVATDLFQELEDCQQIAFRIAEVGDTLSNNPLQSEGKKYNRFIR